MRNFKDIKEDREVSQAIKLITSVYQEIATLRISQLRESVEETTKFLEGVREVYNHAKTAYILSLQHQDLLNKNLWEKLSFIKRNGKTVLVMLSANEHLYGSLIFDIWKSFSHDLLASKADGVVIGTFGKYLAKNHKGLENRTVYFDLNDDKPDLDHVKKIQDFISQYEQIYVYYGKMGSLIRQFPRREQISGGVYFGQKIDSKKAYLFEPSPNEIISFFETEIIGALFNQKIYEHELAKFASRLLAMDLATQNADKVISGLHKESIILHKGLQNKKQRTVFAGFNAWKEEGWGV